MSKTVSGLYDDYGSAREAVAALEGAGIPHADISIVANDADGRHGVAGKSANDAGTGAEIGTAVGGVGGLLAGLGMLAIPGVGPVVAAGWLMATAVGAGAGALVGGAAGGIVGSLTHAGVPERDAHVYAEGVRRGGTLVTARVDETQAGNAQAILSAHRAIDAGSRGDAYRAEGWSRFDEGATDYPAEDRARERARYTTQI